MEGGLRYWDGHAWTAHRRPPTPPPPAPPPTRARSPVPTTGASADSSTTTRSPWTEPLVLATCAAAGLTIVGTLLPWVSVFAFSVAGINTPDGKIVLFAGLFGLAGYALAPYPPAFATIQAILGLIAAGVSIYDTIHVENSISEEDLDFGASVGGGLYLCAAAGVAWVILAVISGVNRRS